MGLTQQQILDLAPDASSRKSGQDMGQARKWSTLGTDGRTLWGEIQGSGSSPYRAAADRVVERWIGGAVRYAAA